MIRVLAGLAAVLAAAAPIPAATANDVMGALRAHVDTADRLFLRVLPVKAYGQRRQALATPVPYAVDVPVTVPTAGRLRLGFAVHDHFFREDLTTQADPIRFRVSLVRPSGEATVVVDRTLDVRTRPSDRRWIDVAVDVSQFAGESVALRLDAETPGTPKAPEKTFALWSRPFVEDRDARQGRPNLLFVTIDALRADHLGCYGYDRPTSPALDRLATEGVRFAHAFSNAPMTIPSLPQIFTSRYFPSASSPTLLSSLFAGGFAHTKAIIHNPYLEYFLTLDARDSFDSMSSVQWHADRIAAKALRWIDANRGDRWALYLHFLDTHTPYHVPLPDATRFVDPSYDGPIGATFGDVEGAQHEKFDAADRAHVIALYDGAIRYVDEHLGRLLEALRTQGLLDNTVVVVSADHGDEFWDHGSFFHGVSLYDEQLHVPLIVRLPHAARAGTVVDPQVRSIDIVPTIVDALGVPAYPDFQGASLLPMVADPAAAAPREVFARAANPTYPLRFAVRTPTHKLIDTVNPLGEALFDLVADPGERRNLVDDPAARPVRDDLRARLAGYRAPLARTGFQIRAVARADADVEVTIAANDDQALVNPDRVGDVGGVLTIAPDGASITWRGRIGPTPVGIRFDRAMGLHDDAGITVTARADGRDLPPDAIVVGADGHPSASPFVYKVTGPKGQKQHEEPPLVVTTAPTPTASEAAPVRVYVWRTLEAAPAAVAPPTDEKTRERLRALGYVQ
jgi:arylsulfatase A-like enzyme